MNLAFCFVKIFVEYIDLCVCCHRFGYDYAGGYEREIGGRPGYGDERPHGRYIGRPIGGYGGPPGNCSSTSKLLLLQVFKCIPISKFWKSFDLVLC